MVSMGLKDAYYFVPIHEEYQKYLKLHFQKIRWKKISFGMSPKIHSYA